MELYIPIERLGRNPQTGRFNKGHVPHNKGKKWIDYMDMRKAKKVLHIAKKNLKPRMDIGGWNRKPVIAIDDDGNVLGWFSSSQDAERKTGICGRNIRNVCNGKRKKAGGFIWQYA